MEHLDQASLLHQYKCHLMKLTDGGTSSDWFATAVRLCVQLQLIDDAREHLHAGLLVHPDSHLLLKEAGTLEATQGNNEKALRYYDQCLELNPCFIEALLNKGSVYLRMGKTDDALSAHKLAVQLSPQSPLALSFLGQTYAISNDYPSALACYEKALLHDINFPRVNYLAGQALACIEQYSCSIQYLEKELTINPASTEAFTLLLDIFLKVEQYHSVLQAVNGTSNNYLLKVNRLQQATALFKLGMHKQCLATLGLLSVDFHPQVGALSLQCLEKLANDARANNNIQELKPLLDQCLLYLKHTSIFNELADIAYREKNFSEAEQYLRCSLELDSAQIEAYVNLLFCLCEQSNWQQASDLALEHLHNCEPISVQIALIYVQAQLRLGNPDKALYSFNQYCTKTPQSIDILGVLADIYSALGKETEYQSQLLAIYHAEASSKNALSLFYSYINTKNYAEAQRILDQAANSTLSVAETSLARASLSYKKDRDLGQARNLASSALQADPYSPDVHLALGQYNHEAGQLTSALLSYRRSLVYGSASPQVFKDIASVFLDSCNYPMSSQFLRRCGVDSEDTNTSQLELVIDAAIVAALQKDIPYLTRLLSKSASLINRGALRNAQIAIDNRRYVAGYHKFLSALLPASPIGDHNVDQQFIHIGDSHCLTYALGSCTVNTLKTSVSPRLIKGVKAWHLASKQMNRYKACVSRVLRTIRKPTDATAILVSMGEIDCRIDEGITPLVVSGRAQATKISEATATLSVSYLESLFPPYAPRRFYLGVPAPCDVGGTSVEEEIRCDVIFNFNKSLRRAVIAAGQSFLDVYELTGGSKLTNNNLHMVDDYHLHPSTLQTLMQEYESR